MLNKQSVKRIVKNEKFGQLFCPDFFCIKFKNQRTILIQDVERIVTMNITDKELMVLEDRMNGEQILIKKYRNYAEQCSDAQLKAICNQIADKHQQHFNTLMGYLQ